MSTPYVGEIRTVGFNFAPVAWMPCNGQLLTIAEYSTLYAVIGTTYGGDGVNTFALPNMQSRVNVGAGGGGGLSRYSPGQMGGVENVVLTTAQLPTHSHPFAGSINASTAGTATNNPAGNTYPGSASSSVYNNTAGADTLAAGAVTGTALSTGGSAAHANIVPALALNVIICVEGTYPPHP